MAFYMPPQYEYLYPIPVNPIVNPSNYTVNQINGQLIYEPINIEALPVPPRGSEVFVAQLPRDVSGNEILPLMEQIGPIYKLRLMMDFSGTNRGFGFVQFMIPEMANKAIELLNGAEIRPNYFIVVLKSYDNCRLYIGNLPVNKTREQIYAKMCELTPNVKDVTIHQSTTGSNRGFAFVEYYTHHDAAMARRELAPDFQLFNRTVKVNWAKPELDFDDKFMQNVKILHMRNVHPTIGDAKISGLFSLNGVLRIEQIIRIRDFAFIHYFTREDAEHAFNILKDQELDKEFKYSAISWAKPHRRSSNRFRHLTFTASESSVSTSVTTPMATDYNPGVRFY